MEPSTTDNVDVLRKALRRAQAFAIANFLPLAFFAALVWALAWPLPGKLVSSWQLSGVGIVVFLNNCLVFLISGLTLKVEQLRAVLQHAWIIAYGIVAINFVTTVLALPLDKLPLHPPEFAFGLAIFAVVPTTLGVGVALTQAARGNTALSLLLTVATNLLGIATVPAMLQAYFASGAVVRINPTDLALKLCLTVLIPTLIGMCVRRYGPGVKAFTERNKVPLSLFSTSNLVMIVWQALSDAQEVLIHQDPVQVLLVVVAACVMHCLYIACNGSVVWAIGFPLKESISVVIMASQKSSPVALAVISYITNDSSQKGLFAIPCMIGQLSQIFIGSCLVRWFARKVEAQERKWQEEKQARQDAQEDQGVAA